MTSGLAGHVARTGEILNIRDAYNDTRFNQEYDKKHNFRTKQILCCPILASDKKKVLAVIQLINKNRGEKFTDQDADYCVSEHRRWYYGTIAGFHEAKTAIDGV